MRIILVSILYFAVLSLQAQEAQREINEQVWKPFIKTFNGHDAEGFMALHSKDVVRSPRDGKVVWNWSEYFQQQQKGDQHDKDSRVTRTLELRFLERIVNNELAIDVGIYKTTYLPQEGESRSFYGKFLVVLRKENNHWKILVDTDSSEGQDISEDDFLAANPME